MKGYAVSPREVEAVVAERASINREMVSGRIDAKEAAKRKRDLFHELPPSIRAAVFSDLEWIPPSMMDSDSYRAVTPYRRFHSIDTLQDDGSGHHPAIQRRASLTPVRRNVLDLVAHGATKENISHILSITENTAKNHMVAVYRILSVHKAADAAMVWRDWSRIIDHEQNDDIVAVLCALRQQTEHDRMQHSEYGQPLTDDMERVLDAAARHVTIACIADEFGLSQRRVRDLLSVAVKRLGVSSRREAIIMWRKGLQERENGATYNHTA